MKKKSSVDGHISYSVVSYSSSFSLVYASGDVAADGERTRVWVPRGASSLGKEGEFSLRTRREVLTYPYRHQTDLQAHTRLKQQALSDSLTEISTKIMDMAVTGFLDTDRCSPVDFDLSLWTFYVIIILQLGLVLDYLKYCNNTRCAISEKQVKQRMIYAR